MLESLINPKSAERKPWGMFFVGIFYASLSMLLSHWFFMNDSVLSNYSGIFMIMFCVIFSLPYIYYSIKLEEQKDIEIEGEMTLLKEHGKVILSFLWLFMGFIVAFSFWYMVLPNGADSFKAQIETFCQINRPSNFDQCVSEYGISGTKNITGDSISGERFISIFSNNVYVLIFTLIFSLIFGAGAIFILAWNASVISAAIGIFAKSDINSLPLGILRYMIHGLPEIAAYFVGALAGGILSFAVIKHDHSTGKFWRVVQDSLNLIIIAILILLISAFIEVFITPRLF
jgi:uncharacterized membrane protein SpoIIM required for sporulation